MAEHNPTRDESSRHPFSAANRSLRCEEWERLMADALDETLPAADSAAFAQHRQDCAACAQMFEQAGRGVAWLSYLEKEPEAPADLLAKILTRTSGTAATAPAISATATTAKVELPITPPLRGWYGAALPAARRMIESRMWMTAAMAFFSIALTLNLIGLRSGHLRLADLRPSLVRPSVVLANVSRQYYSTKEVGVKYYDNLRFVYEMEARVRELRRAQEPAPPSVGEGSPRAPSPSSRNRGQGIQNRGTIAFSQLRCLGESGYVHAFFPPQQALLAGDPGLTESMHRGLIFGVAPNYENA